ncbi:MAG: SDR family NAD(P)-dependent oxidoreductase, partial [SAR202 cluster bacterium]|nr:SDR family NAD(P)-dependent oxidoreductase [SAR202 cluster bacterium]
MNNSEEKKFTNEIALVTGGTQGLGKSIAKMFVQRGVKSIVISGRNENNAKNVIKELELLGAKAFFIKAELSDLQQCSNLIQEIDKKFGKIDILINSAASTERGTILSTSPELFNKIINT